MGWLPLHNAAGCREARNRTKPAGLFPLRVLYSPPSRRKNAEPCQAFRPDTKNPPRCRRWVPLREEFLGSERECAVARQSGQANDGSGSVVWTASVPGSLLLSL